MAAINIAIAGIILVVNVFDVYQRGIDDDYLHYVVMAVFAVGLVVTGWFVFDSAYNEDRNPALIALLATVVLTFYWLALCYFSFFGDLSEVESVCIYYRCPETFWIVNVNGGRLAYDSGYNNITIIRVRKLSPPREDFMSPYYFPHNYEALRRKREGGTVKNAIFDERNPLVTSSDVSNNVTELRDDLKCPGLCIINVNMSNSSYVGASERNGSKNSTSKWAQHEVENTFYELKNTKEKNKSSKIEDDSKTLGSPATASYVIFAINLIFLVFSAVVIWSWASELEEWSNNYEEGDILDQT